MSTHNIMFLCRNKKNTSTFRLKIEVSYLELSIMHGFQRHMSQLSGYGYIRHNFGAQTTALLLKNHPS